MVGNHSHQTDGISPVPPEVPDGTSGVFLDLAIAGFTLLAYW